jgi:hypothetical protein
VAPFSAARLHSSPGPVSVAPSHWRGWKHRLCIRKSQPQQDQKFGRRGGGAGQTGTAPSNISRISACLPLSSTALMALTPPASMTAATPHGLLETVAAGRSCQLGGALVS